MRITRLLAILALVVASAPAVSTRSARPDNRDFWALNNTGSEIREFYVSPHESDSWGKDVLGRSTLPEGMGTVISFESSISSSCVFDFKLVYQDGSSQTYTKGKNVCQVYGVQFNEQDLFGLVRE